MRRLLFGVMLVAAVAARADAAVVEFFDRALFNATVAGVVTFDFETGSGFPLAPAPLDFIDASIDLSTSGGDSVVRRPRSRCGRYREPRKHIGSDPSEEIGGPVTWRPRSGPSGHWPRPAHQS
jgi:hypothetical protein